MNSASGPAIFWRFVARIGTPLAYMNSQLRRVTTRLQLNRIQPLTTSIEMLNGLLQTVSARLLVKYQELDRVNGDLQNLIAITEMPAIFVDENLLVRHFTPQALAVYQVSSQNIGQSLLDVTCNLNYCDLESDFQRVTNHGAMVRRYLERHDGTAWYLMRILPNWCRDGSFGGATMTFVNVNARSRGRA
jgi:two-component system, chemotaxis family, CheB/CheR fusion protein